MRLPKFLPMLVYWGVWRLSSSKKETLQRILERNAMMPFEEYKLLEDSILNSVEDFLQQFKIEQTDCDCPICKDLKSRMEHLEFIIEKVKGDEF
jgi:hypothetical protein